MDSWEPISLTHVQNMIAGQTAHRESIRRDVISQKHGHSDCQKHHHFDEGGKETNFCGISSVWLAFKGKRSFSADRAIKSGIMERKDSTVCMLANRQIP